MEVIEESLLLTDYLKSNSPIKLENKLHIIYENIKKPWSYWHVW